MKFLVDSSEKPYVREALDLMNIDYETTEIKLYFCEDCDNIYKVKVVTCGCGSRKLSSERVADIIIVDDFGNWVCAIERKQGEDLYASLDDRIYTQMEKLSKYFKGNIAIIFEGDLEELAQEHPQRAGQIRSIPATCMQYGVSFITQKDITETIKLLKFFLVKAGQLPKIRAKRFHYHELLPKKMLMFMSIKSVGMKMALKLAQKYDSITDYGIDIRVRGPKLVSKDIPGLGEKGVRIHTLWVC